MNNKKRLARFCVGYVGRRYEKGYILFGPGTFTEMLDQINTRVGTKMDDVLSKSFIYELKIVPRMKSKFSKDADGKEGR